MRFIVLLMMAAGFVNAQNLAEENAVRGVIQTYFDGYAKGDSTILNKAFHPTFQLSWIDPWRNEFQHVNRPGMYAFFSPNWSKLTISSNIVSMNVQRQTAVAIADVELKGIVRWRDVITLLKIKDQWWIVAKVSEGTRLRRPTEKN